MALIIDEIIVEEDIIVDDINYFVT